MILQFNSQKRFNFKQFSLVKQRIQFSISIVFVYTQLNIETVLFQAIQFSVNTQLNVKTVLFQVIQFSIRTQFSSI